jgi:glycosyltransferase involved in cell wall biosynthesis
MVVTQIGFAYDDDLADAEALLARYTTLVGWAEALADAGVQSTVVHRFHRAEEFTRCGVRYVFRAFGLNRALARLEPDVVHVNGLNFPMQTWRCRRLLTPTASLIVQDHASGVPPDQSAARAVQDAIRRRAMKTVDAFFFTSASQAAGWRERGFIGDEQPVYEVLEASTALRPLPSEDARAMTGIAGDPAVLWVGRLNANKSPLTILAGVERAASDLPNLTLNMVFAGGDLEHDVRSRIEQSRVLSARVRLTGRVPHERLAAFYSASDLFVLGSHHEGSGYALLEAYACGALPVVTDVAAFRAITGNGTAGLLWPVDDADQLAKALIAAAAGDRHAARARVRQHFDHSLSWPAVARQAVAAYEAVAARRRARTGVVN